MSFPSNDEVTTVLHRIHAGETKAADELLPLVYDELRLVAERLFRTQARGHTLQPTVLVHEAYVKMVKAEAGSTQAWKDRVHFCRVAAKAMRQILVNHARDKRAAKRGGDAIRITWSDSDFPAPHEADVLSVHEALEGLAELDERHAQICELRFFGGLGVVEVAEVLGVSKRTVELDWRMAKSWLATKLA